jgi:transcriptional regulator with XRE-family HTH domain
MRRSDRSTFRAMGSAGATRELAGQRELGRLIRRMRTEASISGRQLARLASVSQSKISRIETGECPVSPDDVRMFCELLKVDSGITRTLVKRAQEVERQARATQTASWYWTADPDFAFDFERSARTYSVSTPGGVPSLLQSEAAMDYWIDMMNPTASHHQREQVKIVRLERQLQLRNRSKTLRFLIDRSSLMRSFGDADDHLEQLALLRRSVHLENVEIRYIRDNAPAHVGMACWFGVYDESGVQVDGIELDRVSTHRSHVRRYDNVFDELWSRSIGGKALEEVIETARRDLAASYSD